MLEFINFPGGYKFLIITAELSINRQTKKKAFCAENIKDAALINC